MATSQNVVDTIEKKSIDEGCAPKTPRPKSTWKNRIDFLMNFFGLSIGLANVWRFPYLCYKNGGGVFLIAYMTLIAVFVIPAIILELSMGQYTRCSGVKVWKMMPLMRGIGYAGFVLLLYCNVYYPVVMAWSLRWLVAGFSSDLPWTNCENTWNTPGCIPLIKHDPNLTQGADFSDTIEPELNETRLSSVEEFWRKHVIDFSSGIEEIGEVKWELALCLLGIWVLVYFSTWKGIGWMSKVVYVTATLPVVMIIIVLIRGLTLEGASIGIRDYLKPNITKLGDFEVWTDAANQVTFSFGIGYGALATLSSHNNFDHNLLRDAIFVSVANGITSFISGFAIFSVLGHLASVKNTTLSAVAESGPGLVFIAYPTALSFLPAPNFWMVLFFITLIFLGLDTLFVLQEGVFESIKDLTPRLFQRKWNHEIGHALLAGIMFILGLSLVTRGGIYIFHIINTYSVAGWCVFFTICCETAAMGWIYDASKLCDKIQEMVKWRVPRIWLILSWKIVSPVITLTLMFYSLYNFKRLSYDGKYFYPVWAGVIAWISAFSSVILVPITAGYVIWKSKGKTFLQKLRNAMKPSSTLKDHANSSTIDMGKPMLENDV